MSHIAKIELVIKSLEDLKKACHKLGLKFCEDQKSYKWYGEWIGDEPLPKGVKEEDLGKCDHMIHVPGASYQIGVVKIGNNYQLLWDFWKAGGLEKVLGKNAGKLKQSYAIERIRRKSKLQRFRIAKNENRNPNGSDCLIHQLQYLLPPHFTPVSINP